MNHDFWLERWQRDEIGFHQQAVHRYLPRHWPSLALPPGARVFVPLCGKSRDMLWLRDAGFEVIGVELSLKAAHAFCGENELSMSRRRDGPFECFHGGGIALLVGDFFDLRPGHIAGVAAAFDRAALVALPPSARARYAAHMAALLPAGTQTLLVTLEYDQRQMEGPPFSVAAEEVRELYAGSNRMEPLQREEIIQDEPKFRGRGLTALAETAWRLDRV
ncbi:MAG: thiopurine S-methyltransferase [Gammaproteobacteria bacterium]|nr:thiopurine S-methyltransferase [Gammaproteobacteria bacterium]MCG3144317.1 Thiopurine S-methyltransferase [Gammaproteobacteria bacterium]